MQENLTGSHHEANVPQQTDQVLSRNLDEAHEQDSRQKSRVYVLSNFAEIVSHNFIRQIIMEAFGEDIGPRPVSIYANSHTSD